MRNPPLVFLALLALSPPAFSESPPAIFQESASTWNSGALAASPSASVEVSINPSHSDRDLFVTILFRDTPSLQLTWQSVPGGEVVSQDIQSGLEGLNKKTVRIPSEVFTSAGTLTIAAPDNTPAIIKVHLEWAKASTSFVSPDEESPHFIDAGGNTLTLEEVSDQPELSLPDVWKGEVLEVSLQEQAESLTGNLEVAFALSEVPQATNLRMQMSGIPLGEAPIIWVNGTRLGPIAPFVPKLADPGYIELEGIFTYVGWRAGSAYIPTRLLRVGENTILFECPFEGAYMKQAYLQFLPQPKPAVGTAFSEESAANAGEDIINHPTLVQETTHETP